MTTSDTFVLYLPSSYITGTDYTLSATLKYPDSTFSTVDHVFYYIDQAAVDASN